MHVPTRIRGLHACALNTMYAYALVDLIPSTLRRDLRSLSEIPSTLRRNLRSIAMSFFLPCEHNNRKADRIAFLNIALVLVCTRAVNHTYYQESITQEYMYATVISFLWARCAARCPHYIIQLQSAHCGKSNTALSLQFEMNFRTELEFTRQNSEIV